MENFIEKYKTYIGIGLVALILIGGGLLLFSSPESKPIEITETSALNSEKIKVDVEGAVKKPGVYEMEGDARVIDVIKAAGGALGNADLSAVEVSLAAKLIDGQRIVVPVKGDVLSSSSSTQSVNKSVKIHINRATQAELEALPGIGEVLASRIIEYRETKGSFKNIEEIKNVKGIGDAKFEDIKNLITI